jgi:hypothetical protein
LLLAGGCSCSGHCRWEAACGTLLLVYERWARFSTIRIHINWGLGTALAVLTASANIRLLVHQTVSKTLDFHEGNVTTPLPQFSKERENDIKVHYLLQTRVKITTSPLGEDVKKDQKVYKDQYGCLASMTVSNILQELEETSLFCADSLRCKGATNGS